MLEFRGHCLGIIFPTNALLFNFVYFFSMMNCALIDVVPLEFFYLENIGSFFGSYAVFYMGVYGYGTLVTLFNKNFFIEFMHTAVKRREKTLFNFCI